MAEAASRGALPAAALVGREEERVAAVRAASGAPGCVIAGPAGIGKSRLAAEVSTTVAGRKGRVVRVVATASASTVPFGAFGHLDAVPGEGREMSIPVLIDRIRATHPTGLPTLLVDDAHLLDDASAATLLSVATSRAATLLVTVRSLERCPDAVVSLWKDAGVPRVDLQPLSASEVRALVESLLGAPAHALAQERIYELSQGNPLYVEELVIDGQRTGALVRRRGRWHWESERLEFGRLQDIVGARTRDVSPEARHALELVAVGGPLRVEDVASITTPSALEELERRRLVTTTESPGALEVDLAHPLYGEVVVADTPALARRRHQRDLAKALALHGDGGDDQELRVATWLLEAGETDPPRFTATSAIALRRGDPALANRLAEAAGGGLEPALRLAQARIGLAQFDDAEPLLEPWEDAACTSPSDIATTYVETRFRALLRGSRHAEAEALLDRAAAWDGGRDWAALLATQRGWRALYDGRPAQAIGHIEEFIDDSDLTPERRFHLLAVAVYGLTRIGRSDDCERLDQELQALVPRLRQAPWEAGFALILVDSVARINAGRDLRGVAERLDSTMERAEASGDRALVSVVLHATAGLALSRGHAAEASRLFAQAFDHMSAVDPLNSGAWTAVYLALARGMCGDADGADRALHDADGLLATQPRLAERIRPEIERARVWADVARGEHSRARERALAISMGCGEDLLGRAEAVYLALVLFADPRSCAEQLEVLADGCQNEVLRLYARHARAVADRDASQQAAVAERFEEIGYDLHAAEAAARAAQALRETGHTEPSRRAAALAARCQARCEGARTPGLSLLRDVPALSSREHEVAVLAAKGHSNAEIAESLVISIRTVESHVLNGCRKLGVANRHELARAIDATT